MVNVKYEAIYLFHRKIGITLENIQLLTDESSDVAIYPKNLGGDTHPHSEAEHGEADTVAEAGRGQEPGPGRRGGLAADVVDYELGCLPLALSSPRPLGPALLSEGAVEHHDELQAPLVQTGL